MRKIWIFIIIAGVAIIATSAFEYLTRLGKGDAAPDFALTTVEGVSTSLADYQGKPVLLHFFATWCGPCQAEFPSLNPFQAALSKEGLTVLAVSEDEDAAALKAFVEYMKPAFPVLVDDQGLVSNAYQSWAVPESFLIGPNGTILWRHSGPLDWSSKDVQAKVSALLAE